MGRSNGCDRKQLSEVFKETPVRLCTWHIVWPSTAQRRSREQLGSPGIPSHSSSKHWSKQGGSEVNTVILQKATQGGHQQGI